jgi:hypothetical protein
MKLNPLICADLPNDMLLAWMDGETGTLSSSAANRCFT